MTMMTSLPTAIIAFAYTGVLPGTMGRTGYALDPVVSADAVARGLDERAERIRLELQLISAERAERSIALLPAEPPRLRSRRPFTVYVAPDAGNGCTYTAGSRPAVRAASVDGALRAAHTMVRDAEADGVAVNVLLRCEDGIWRDRTHTGYDVADPRSA